VAHRPDEAAHLGQRRAPGLLDADERIAILAKRIGEPVPHGADLEHHHADCVGDDVMELADDAGALLGNGDAGGCRSFKLGLRRAFLRRFGLLGTLAHRKAAQPADPEQQRDEDQRTGRVPRLVVDHRRRGAQHDGQTDPSLQGIAQVPEHVRGRHPEHEHAAQERDQPSVDERERHRGGEREAPTREERQHRDREGRHGEPQGRPGRVPRVASDRDLEHCFGRQQHDQGVDRVPARNVSGPAHALKVLHARAGRLLPG